MLLTKEVEIKINANTVEYYKSLGYEIPMKRASESTRKRHKKDFVYDFSKTIIVQIDDLSEGSREKVEVLCDYCKEEIILIPYVRYLTSTALIGKCACKKCSGEKQADCNFLKYGVYNTSQLDWVQEKQKNTNISKYGVDNYAKTKECHDKMKSTIESSYGVSHYSQTQEYKEKRDKTCTERYGDSYSKRFMDKAFETFRNKTGYNYPSQSPEVREKITQSYVDKFGVDNPNKAPEVRTKITQTLYQNSSQKASKQQRYINSLYHGILNFPVKYYNVDICLPDDKLVIEYDGGFHMGNVITGRETQEEFDRKELIRDKVIKSEGYKTIRIKSSRDLLPQDSTLLLMLETARTYFSEYPQHSWLEYDLDTSTLRNAENKEGVFFNFGELRKISSDVA